MTLTKEDICSLKMIVYEAKITDDTRKTLYHLIDKDMESLVVGCFEAYQGRKEDAQFYDQCRELMDHYDEDFNYFNYFKGLHDAVGNLPPSDLSKNYFLGWLVGYKSFIRYE